MGTKQVMGGEDGYKGAWLLHHQSGNLFYMYCVNVKSVHFRTNVI